MNDTVLVLSIVSAIVAGTPILFATLGEILTERSGVMNLVEFLSCPSAGSCGMLAEEEKLDRAAKALGCTVDWPFMYLFFLPSTSIPDYAITDVGTVDVAAMDTFGPVLGPAV